MYRLYGRRTRVRRRGRSVPRSGPDFRWTSDRMSGRSARYAKTIETITRDNRCPGWKSPLTVGRKFPNCFRRDDRRIGFLNRSPERRLQGQSGVSSHTSQVPIDPPTVHGGRRKVGMSVPGVAMTKHSSEVDVKNNRNKRYPDEGPSAFIQIIKKI